MISKKLCYIFLTFVFLINLSILPIMFKNENATKVPNKKIEKTIITKEYIKELDELIKRNEKRLSLKTDNHEKRKGKISDKKLEKKIASYIHKDEFWQNGKKKKLSKDYCKKLAKIIVKNTKYPIIITSIIYTESAFNRKAVNKYTGALGLGQITPIHKKELIDAGIIEDFTDLKKPEANIKAIDYVLRNKLKITYGNMDEALRLYSGNATNYQNKIWEKVTSIRNHNENI